MAFDETVRLRSRPGWEHVHCWLPPEQAGALKQLAKRHGLSVSGLAVRVLTKLAAQQTRGIAGETPGSGAAAPKE